MRIKGTLETVNAPLHHVQVHDDVQSMWDEWSEMSDRLGQHVSSRPTYNRSALESRSTRKTLVVTVHRDDRLVAVAPFVTRTYGKLTVARMMGDNMGMLGEFLTEDDDAADAVWDELERRRIAVYLREVDDRDRTVARLLANPRWRTHTAAGPSVLLVDLPKHQSGAAGLRSKRSRRRLRSTRSSLESANTPLEIEFAHTKEQLAEQWPDMQRLSALGVAGRDRFDFLGGSLGPLVYRVLEAEADAGRLIIVSASVDGVRCGQLLMVRSGDTLEGWLTHYDPAFEDIQPGHQMMERLADHSREHGAYTVDLGVGPTGFKEAWTTRRHSSLTVTAVPSGSALALAAARRLETTTIPTRVRSLLRR